MRIWLDPERIAARGLTAEQVLEALRAQNVQVAGGALGEPPVDYKNAFQVSLQMKGRLQDRRRVRGHHRQDRHRRARRARSRTSRRVELGALSYSAQGYADRYPAVIVVVDQQPGSNAVRATQGIKDAMAEMAKSFPKGLEYRITYNPDRVHRGLDHASSTSPSWRRRRWWCWWCCCSSRPGARRSFPWSPSPCR